MLIYHWFLVVHILNYRLIMFRSIVVFISKISEQFFIIFLVYYCFCEMGTYSSHVIIKFFEGSYNFVIFSLEFLFYIIKSEYLMCIFFNHNFFLLKAGKLLYRLIGDVKNNWVIDGYSRMCSFSQLHFKQFIEISCQLHRHNQDHSIELKIFV